MLLDETAPVVAKESMELRESLIQCSLMILILGMRAPAYWNPMLGIRDFL